MQERTTQPSEIAEYTVSASTFRSTSTSSGSSSFNESPAGLSAAGVSEGAASNSSKSSSKSSFTASMQPGSGAASDAVIATCGNRSGATRNQLSCEGIGTFGKDECDSTPCKAAASQDDSCLREDGRASESSSSSSNGSSGSSGRSNSSTSESSSVVLSRESLWIVAYVRMRLMASCSVIWPHRYGVV